jgi:hypothetical protein
MAKNDDVSARIAELTQELSAAFVTVDEPFAAGVDRSIPEGELMKPIGELIGRLDRRKR